MAKIVITGDALVVISALKLEDLKRLEKYRYNSLALKDERGAEVFRIGTTTGYGSVSDCGISFSGETHDEEKFATVTIAIPPDTEDAIKYAEEKVGAALIKLNSFESVLKNIVSEIDDELRAVRESITVI